MSNPTATQGHGAAAAEAQKLCPVEFTPREREGYGQLKSGAAAAIDEAYTGKSGTYCTILQRIEWLRLFCGLGLH